MKTIDLSDLKAGDKAWSCIDGLVVIEENASPDIWCIKCSGEWYAKNGIFNEEDTHPTLFHSKQEFREYWDFGATLEAFEPNQLTKREQFAMAAMQGLLAAPVIEPVKIKDLVSDAIDVADFMLTKLNEKQ